MSLQSPLACLWSHAQAALAALCASLAPLTALSAAERRSLRGLLRGLEGFCRRLALTEALALVREGWPSATRGTTRAARRARQQRRPALRLWPRVGRVHVRVRVLGPATSVHEIQTARRHAALAAQLAAVRERRKLPHVRLADRLDALQRFLGAPLRAIRGLARKLRRAPKLAVQIAARRTPPAPFIAPASAEACKALCFAALNSS